MVRSIWQVALRGAAALLGLVLACAGPGAWAAEPTAQDYQALKSRLDAVEAAVRDLQNQRGGSVVALQPPTPQPVQATGPAQPPPQAVRKVLRATVGPGQQCPHLVDCWLAAYQQGATDVFLTVMPVPNNPAYYQNDISGQKPVVGYLPFNVTMTAAPMRDGSRQMVLLPIRGPAGDVMPTGKGWLIPQRNFTIDGFHITGGSDGRVGNFAAIRTEGTNQTIVIRNCEFDHWGNGVLGTSTGGSITFDHVYLHDNGDGSGSTHGMYLAAFDRVELSHVLSVGVDTGHLMKTRGKTLEISNSRFFDLDAGTSSFGIDVPDGAVATIRDTVIQRGAKAQNGPAIAFAEERLPDDRPKSLTLSNVTIVSQTPSGTPFMGTVAVWNPTGAAVNGQNVQMFGVSRLMQDQRGLNSPLPGVVRLDAAPRLDMTSPVFASN